MILLDTNVVSEAMAPAASRAVLRWLNDQESETLYLSTVTIAEIGYGLEILPEGRRRRSLTDRFERFVATGFSHRVLSFDERAARLYGQLMGHRRKQGRPMSVLGGQIAAIARASRFAVATRNVRGFEACGVELVNPFESGPRVAGSGPGSRLL